MKLSVENLLKIIERNWLNIVLISFLFNTSKKIAFEYTFIRGFNIDYFLPKIHLNIIFLSLLSLVFIKFLKNYKNNFKYIFGILLFLILNVLFSINIVNSFFYFSYIFTIFFIFLVSFSIDGLKINYKLILLVNLFYIFIFLVQYFSQQSFLPYFPFGTYYFNALNTHLDYSSLFGVKVLIPAVNFSHPNVLCAFLSFLNIFHLRNKNYLFFGMNFFVILLCASFVAILFNLILFISLIWNKFGLNKFRFFLVSTIYFLVSTVFLLYFFYFGFKEVSITERFFQFTIFQYSLSHFPLFGTGANNFIYLVNIYENFKGRIFVLQPIHNVFLLILSEYGISVLVLIFFLFKRFKKYLKPSVFLFYLVFFSFFDHFFVTLNQGFLLVLLTIYMHKSIIISNAP